MKKLRVSVIGAGHLGRIHLKLLSQNTTIDLVGVFDTNSDITTEQAQMYNITSFSGVDEAISSSDAIFIIVPTSEHFAISQKAIKQQKHLYIEKPVCSNYDEATELIALASQYNDVKIQVGHIERFNPVIVHAQRYNLNPQFVETHRLTQFTPRGTDVSVIHDLMIHDIDLVLWMAKLNDPNIEVKSIDANGVSIITKDKDIANARITFNNGLVANLTASRLTSTPMRKFRLFQEAQYISLDLQNHKIELFNLVDKNTSQDIQSQFVNFGNKLIQLHNPIIKPLNAMDEEQKAFFNAIYNDKTTACTLSEGAQALEIAEKISDIIGNL